MKKILAFVLVFIVCLGLAACGRRNKDVPADTVPTTSAPITTPTEKITEPTVVIPTMETNIPDPDVDTRMTESTEEVRRGMKEK